YIAVGHEVIQIQYTRAIVIATGAIAILKNGIDDQLA
ncbi:uncharacterized protein METZ01_LOCUS186970, partial [marine metagenome]